jgi:hypothetical protein
MAFSSSKFPMILSRTSPSYLYSRSIFMVTENKVRPMLILANNSSKENHLLPLTTPNKMIFTTLPNPHCHLFLHSLVDFTVDKMIIDTKISSPLATNNRAVKRHKSVSEGIQKERKPVCPVADAIALIPVTLANRAERRQQGLLSTEIE